jgi:cell shape-determining protein MreD
MRSSALTIIWTLFWIVAESTLLRSFPSETIRLDVLFLSVLAIGFKHEWHEGLTSVLLIGLICDAVSPAPFGIASAAYAAAFFAVRAAGAAVYLRSVTARLVWTCAASAFYLWLKAGALTLVFGNPFFVKYALLRFVPQSLFNALAGLMFIPMFWWFTGLTWEKIVRPKGLVLR